LPHSRNPVCVPGRIFMAFALLFESCSRWYKCWAGAHGGKKEYSPCVPPPHQAPRPSRKCMPSPNHVMQLVPHAVLKRP
jgi:hypothetical protein